VDSLPGIQFSVDAAFGACGVPYRAFRLREMVGPPIRSILERVGNLEDSQIIDRLETEFRSSYDSEGWKKTVCFPGVRSALFNLKSAGYRLFVATNKPRHISLRILEAEAILEFFDAVVTRDSIAPAYANKEEVVRSVLISNGLQSNQCVLIGDTSEDALAAQINGVKFVFFTHGYGQIEKDSTLPVHFAFDEFSQLLPRLVQEFTHDR
jgi:phosphoglycolate phosphatase